MKKNTCENCHIEFDRHYVRRFCSKHCWHQWNAKTIASYNCKRFQWKSSTDEEKKNRIKKRFEKCAIKNEGCWDWKGYCDKDGYPLLNSGANGKGFKERRGHRISWLIHFGEIPEGKKICHTCDNPRCTNPKHLFLGTALDNNQDKVRKGRSNVGIKHGNSKLDDEKIRYIRQMYDEGYKITVIMEKFNICRMHAHSIGKRKSWKHVE